MRGRIGRRFSRCSVPRWRCGMGLGGIAAQFETLIGGFGGADKSIEAIDKQFDEVRRRMAKAKTPEEVAKLHKDMEKISQELQALSRTLAMQNELAKSMLRN